MAVEFFYTFSIDWISLGATAGFTRAREDKYFLVLG
jgi:hypothetical protein